MQIALWAVMLLWARLRPASALRHVVHRAVRRGLSAAPVEQHDVEQHDLETLRETRWSATSVLRF